MPRKPNPLKPIAFHEYVVRKKTMEIKAHGMTRANPAKESLNGVRFFMMPSLDEKPLPAKPEGCFGFGSAVNFGNLVG